MSIGEDTFNGLYANTEFRGTIETKDGAIIACVCQGLQTFVLETDNGRGQVLQGLIHIKTADRTETGLQRDDKLIYTDAVEDVYNVRINGTKQKQGMFSLSVESQVK